MATNRDDKYFDINIDSGGDFSFSFTLFGEGSTPTDLTGCIVTAKLREYPEGTDETLFTATHNNTGGQITISLPHETTAALGSTYGKFEVKVRFPTTVEEEVMHGKAFITAGVTRICNPGTINQIVAFSDFDSFPETGSIYRIYLDQTTYNLYWWTGSEYVSLTYAMRGKAATIRIGTVETLDPDDQVYFENVGTDTDAIFNIGIPKGDRGDAGTMTVGDVTTVEAGYPATVTNVGTPEDAVLDFEIPRGYTGWVGYASFEVDLSTGDLMMRSNADILGATFSLSDDGDLLVEV